MNQSVSKGVVKLIAIGKKLGSDDGEQNHHDTTTRMLIRVLVALLLSANSVAAFINIPTFVHISCKSATLLLQSPSGKYTAGEVQEMDALIISLSLESTDKSRRQRLASVFAEELVKVDTNRRFADLFDQVLAEVGDRVQVKAKKKALEKQRNEPEEKSTEDQVDEENDGDFMSMGKSPEERQLWALVDMMVQSKTLAKKAFGELGNKGTLQ